MTRLFTCLAILATATPPAFAQTTSAELKLDLGSGVTMDMILVQPGSFQQGSPVTEAGREEDETARQVTLTKAFYIGKHPVTRGQFARFVAATNYRTEAEKGSSGGFGVEGGKLVQRKQFTWRNPGFPQTDDHPVVIVTADDAKAFNQWLSRQTRYDCQLPSEAQWEYACRAGTATAHYSEPVDEVAWHRGNSDAQTHPVGQKKPNAWGLHDLYGPVWQWCSDWYGPYPPNAATDPLQTNRNLSDKPRQVLRGGSFMSDISHSRSAERYRNDAKSRNADNGFRIVCSTIQRAAPPPAAPRPAQPPVAPAPPLHSTDDPVFSPPEQPGGFNPVKIFVTFIVALLGYKVIRGFLGSLSRPHTRIGTESLTPREAADQFGSQPPPIAQRFAFQLTDSGFYINGPEAAVGSQIQYTADLGNRVLSDDIVFSPGPDGHFIFTGVRPKSVRVQTMGGQLGTTGGFTSSSSFDDDHRRSFSSSSGSSFPSAY